MAAGVGKGRRWKRGRGLADLPPRPRPGFEASALGFGAVPEPKLAAGGDEPVAIAALEGDEALIEVAGDTRLLQQGDGVGRVGDELAVRGGVGDEVAGRGELRQPR